MSPGVIALIILGLCIVLFLTNWIPSVATACLGCVLMALFNVTTFAKVFSGFSNTVVILVFCMMTVGIAMQRSGLAYDVGQFILRFTKKEKVFVVVATLCAGLLSMLLSNTAVIAMFLSIMNSVVQSSPDMKLKHICLPVSMGSMFGGVCTLIGSTPQASVQSIMQEVAGISYSMFDYMPVGLILFAIFIVYYLLYGYNLAHKIWPEDNTDQAKLDDYIKKHADITKGSKKDKIIVAAILVLMVVLFATEVITNTMTSLVVMLLLVIFRQLDEKEVYRKMDWATLIRLAGCLGLAAGLQDSGAADLIADGVLGLLGDYITETSLFALTVVLSMLISNFITNSTAVFIVLPPILAIAVGAGFNPAIFGIGCCYAINLSFATPLANAQTGMTMVAGYEFSDYAKYNLLLEIILAVAIIIFVPMFF